jgi:hypothetical protein
MRQFGKEAANIGVETLTQRIEKLAAKYGDDVFLAVRKVGPRALEQYVARQYGPESIKLMARYGDDAIWIIERPDSMAMFFKYGENAAESMIKHRTMANSLLAALGQPAAGALRMISAQNARRLAILTGDGQLAKIGRTPELLGVIGKYGDDAADFIWRNKGALTIATALTAFLANPDMFIEGTADINKVGEQATPKPGPAVPIQPVVSEAEKQTTNWTGTIVAALCVIGLLAALGALIKHHTSEPGGKPSPYQEI